MAEMKLEPSENTKKASASKKDLAVQPNTPKREKAKHKTSGVIKNASAQKKVKPKREKDTPARLYLNDQFYANMPFIQKMSARKSLGLDIDADKVRYVLVNKTKTEIQVLEWGYQQFPSEEKDRRKALQIALENVKSKVYKKGLQTHASIFSPEISSRHVVFPKMKKESDLKQAIYHKNESDLQNFDDKTIWTYEIIDSFEDEELEKLKLAITAAPAEVINRYLSVFEAANIELASIISRPSAIQAAYRRMIFRPGRDLLIDIGYDLTQMCFIKNGNVEFVRNVSIGSRNLEVTIHSNPKDADENKAGGKSVSGGLSADKPEEVRNRLLNRIKDLKNKQNPVLHTFFSEILRSLAFFQGKNVQQYIERIFVTGYGIRKESLLPYLKSRLNIPLFILTPQFEERPNRTTEFGEYFSTLGTTLQDSKAANLLPQHYKTKLLFKKLNMGLSTLLALLVVVLGLLWNGQHKLIAQKKALIRSYHQEYEALNPVEGKYREIQQLIGDVNKKNNELKSYIQQRPPVVEILRLFSNEVPPTIRLDKLNFIQINKGSDKKKFKNDFKYQLDIDGIITTDPLMADVTLINFVNHLIDLKYFKHIELLNKLKDPEKKITRFGIRVFL